MSDFILARVSQTLAAEQSLETLVRQLLEMLEAVTRMESTYLTRIDINAQRQQIMFAHNSSEMQIPEGFSVPWDESMCKRALEDQCTFSNDVANRWHSCIAAQELGIATFLSIPVRLADGSLFGTLCATSRQQQPYNLEGEQVMGLFAKLISHYVEKDTLVQQLQAANVALELHSSTDELTQLPNRRALFKQLALRFASARAQQQQVALIFIDLDGFKLLNDAKGHQAGDMALKLVADSLKTHTRRTDVVARLGGDEFVILMPNTGSAACLRLTRQLVVVIAHHMARAGFGVTASIGSATFTEAPESATTALQRADAAMYEAKARGKGCAVDSGRQ